MKTASLALMFLTAAGTASAATTVNMKAQRAVAALPDGATVPMWEYCGAAASGGAGYTVGGACPAAAPGAWAPGPTVVVPVGDALTIVLQNGLTVPTSLTIVGQYGGSDLGTPDRVAANPAHPTVKGTTWPVNGGAATFTPPAQALRARSFGPEAAPAGSVTYTWPAGALKPGTYLYETGTHPSLQAPMGLYGVLIVTAAPAVAVTPATATAAAITSITAPGLAYSSSAKVMPPPGANLYGFANAGVPYDADATFLLSEIDPVQNLAVDAAAQAGTAEDLVSADPSCVQARQGGTTPCYPPAVNYRPTYFLINGSPFNPANPAATTATVVDAAFSGNVLVRFVNAGLRVHVPVIPGLPMSVISEDGNLAPGLPKVQSEVNLPPGRTADVLVQPTSNGIAAAANATPVSSTVATAYGDAAYAVFDRALSLAGGNLANAGMHGYLAVAPTGTNAAASTVNAFLGTAAGGVATQKAVAADYSFTLPPNVLATFTASVATNSVGVGTPATGAAPLNGSLTWDAAGNFTYTPATAPIAAGDTFTYCSSQNASLCGTVTLTVSNETAGITAPTAGPVFNSPVSSLYRAITRSAGVLAGYAASDGYPLVAALSGTPTGCTVLLNPDGSFSAAATSRGGSTCTFGFTATDSRTKKSATATATVNFPVPSGLAVTVADALNGVTANIPAVTDYMWIIEEDQTYHNATPGVTPPYVAGQTPPPTLAVSFFRSAMPVVAAGCTGPISCGDGAGGQSIQGVPVPAATYSTPADVKLDPSKYYFISVLPGDAANPFIAGFGGDPISSNCLTPSGSGAAATQSTLCGHSLGGAPIAPGQLAATVKVEPNPLHPATLSIYIFEDNSPTNNDYDANEVGLGGFEIIVNDVAGRSGDPVGQITYDAFNMPLTNSLLGVAGCPNETPAGKAALQQTNLVGVVYTCPDGDRPISAVSVTSTLVTVTTSVPHQFGTSVQGPGPTIDVSGLGAVALNGSFPVTVTGPNTFTFANPGVPANTKVLVVKSSMARDATTYQLAGQALINNIMPGRYDVLAHPGAAREGAGETWYQVSTLEGTPGQDAFTKANEPNYFQEFGPPGFHTFIGFVNPLHLSDQNKVALDQAVSAGVTATTTISGRVTSLHMSRTIMETLWDSASNAAIAQSNCFVALNQTGETGNDVAFTACKPDGTFTLPPVPAGQQYELVIWDQWLDQIISFKNLPANQVTAGGLALGDIPVFSWFTRIEASIYLDTNGNGIRDPGEPGLSQLPVINHFRDGSVSNVLTTDGNGNAVFNELFPLFNWYVIESDQARYTYTGVNVVVDAGGLPDCVDYDATSQQGTLNLGNSRCPHSTNGDAAADLGARTGGVSNSSYLWTDPTTGKSYGAVPAGASTSTSRVDPATTPFNGMYQGVQTFINQTQMIDYGRRPYNPGENGGISGNVFYASTRGFDDPGLEVQFFWEPGIARVTVNLYKEQTNPDGTTGLKLVNTQLSTSWDDWVNLVYGADKNKYLLGADNVLRDPVTGAAAPAAAYPSGAQVNMTCPGQDPNDPYLPYALGASNQFKCYDGFHMWNQVQPAVFDGSFLFTTDSSGTALTPGRYVVEVVPPQGYEIVKEEDKNILIGDQWIAPPAQQFGGLSNIFIMPDQVSLANAYNPNNPGNNNTTMALGFTQPNYLLPKCVGQLRQVPDYMSLFPSSGQVAPFAGAMRPLCDRKEVVLNDQTMVNANFFLFTNTPKASHFTGLMLDDAAAEINNAAPDFGEKFAAAYAPISLKDFNGIEISRVYTDQWGTYNGLAPSTWQVNVPNPAGYSPAMMVNCMNDPGPIPDPAGSIDPATGKVRMIVDPLYNPSYSNFCYTNPFMPAMTVYLDTPILPVAAFAAGYNPPDCALPAATPAIFRVDGDGKGPWVKAADGTHSITITALGDVLIPNPNYQGPSASTAPYNTKTITRHYGFGTTKGSVTVGGVPLTVTAWTDTSIVASVPTGVTSGEVVIVSSAGTKSVDMVTLTVGQLGTKTSPAGKVQQTVGAPTVVEPAASTSAITGNAHPIQDAIDAAAPGDLIIVDAGTYQELVVMWKPVRLQGVGAPAVIINAAKFPTQKLQNWRPEINKYFGVDTVLGNQVPNSQVDPLPNQEITGGIVLLEPSVLATEEGAGITVLAKNPDSVAADGVTLNATCGNPATSSYPDQVLFPPSSNTVNIVNSSTRMSDSNFSCAASRIDGLSVTGGDSGGGIYVNGWANGLEIANTRVYGNAGSFNGGIRVGVPYLEGLTGTRTNRDGTVFGYDVGVNIHHNVITNNGTVEANPGAVNSANSTGVGGGLSICTGTDNYVVRYNFICGNYSSGDGGGIGQTGVSNGGLIAQNTIIFNQSYQQTAQVNGGGIIIEGELGAVGGLSLGTGSVTIDGNVIRGNFAQGGHGGGIRLQQVNGADVSRRTDEPSAWYKVLITNNMITNNVSGWAGGGISVQDALNVVVDNNTIANNDSMGIVGTMIGTNPLNRKAPLANTTGYPSPAGISVDATTPSLLTGVRPPKGGSYQYANVTLLNDILWHNRSFFFALTPQATGVNGGLITSNTLCPSNTVADAYAPAATCTPLPVQSTVGECVKGAQYWDIGTTDDQSAGAPASNPGRFTLQPSYSLLSSTTGYAGLTGVVTGDPAFVVTGLVAGQEGYCNGARANPAFIFEPGQPFLTPAAQNLTVGATLDEAGNYVDVRFGPLYLNLPEQSPSVGPPAGTLVADYHLTGAGSAYNAGAAIGAGPATLSRDIDGDVRPRVTNSGSGVDMGADEYTTPGPLLKLATSGAVLGKVQTGQTGSFVVDVTNLGTAGTTLSVTGVTFAPATAFYSSTNTCTSVPVGAACTVTVTFAPLGNGFAATGTAEPAIMSIASNATNGTQTVALSAVAFPPLATVSSGAFAGYEMANVSTPHTLTVSNSGYGPWYPAPSASVTGAGFALGTGGSCSATVRVPAGGNCTLVVNVSPTAIASYTGSLTVNESAYLGNANTTLEQTISQVVPLSALGPDAIVTPNPLAFGSVVVGTSKALSLTVASGPTPLTNLALGALPGGFSPVTTGPGAGTCGATLAANSTCSFVIQFAPPLAQSYGGSLAVTSSQAIAGAPVALTGTGIAAIKTLGITPTSANFGSLALGAAATQTFTVTNTGNVSFAGGTVTTAAPFSVTGTQTATDTCGSATFAPGASCSVTVTYRPTVFGSFSGSLAVALGSGGLTAAVSAPLSGTAVGAGVSPGSLVFGNVPVGTTSILSLNVSAGAVAISGFVPAAYPAGFSRVAGTGGGSCGANLAANAACTLVVQFAPTAVQAYSGSFGIAGQSVSVGGSGIAAVRSLRLSPTALAFGTHVLNTSTSLTVTVTNSGNVTLAGGSVSAPAPFSVPAVSTAGDTCGAAAFAPGATCTMTVTYRPTTAGASTGTLAINLGGASATAALTGTATAFTLAANPTSLILPSGGVFGRGVTLNVTRVTGFTGSVSFAVSGVPAGMIAIWTNSAGRPSNLATTATEYLTLRATSATSVKKGAYALVVTGTSGASLATLPLSVTVQ